MARALRYAFLVPSLIALLSLLLSTMAAGGPCPPFEGC